MIVRHIFQISNDHPFFPYNDFQFYKTELVILARVYV